MRPDGPAQGDILPESVTWKNADGDKMHVEQISFRCKGCGIGVTTIVPPHAPLVSKYRCRRCDYITEVQTRESVMDDIENHIEEGAYEEKLKTRATNHGRAGLSRPGHVAEVIGGKLVWVKKREPS